jgi:hypothetical protein
LLPPSSCESLISDETYAMKVRKCVPAEVMLRDKGNLRVFTIILKFIERKFVVD